MPYAHFRGPEFKAFRRGRTEWIEQVSAEYGADRIAAVWVHNLPGDVSTFIFDGISAACRPQEIRRTAFGAYNSLHVLVVPVDDVSAVAAKIEFGKVTRVDVQRRTIVVEADPAKLPPPVEPMVHDPNAPQFYERNLEDLRSWDRYYRRAATGRLRHAAPKKLRTEVAAALVERLRDELAITRRLAAEALGIMGLG